MTEAEWLASSDPVGMIRWAGHVAWTERKARLFCVACARRVYHLFPDPAWGTILVGCERFADGHTSDEEHAGVDGPLCHSLDILQEARADGASARCHAAEAVVSAAIMPCEDFTVIDAVTELLGQPERGPICGLVRDIVGNPFRPVAVESDWRTTTVVALARGIYADRAFDRLPVLADALEDAGCTNADLLGHCRDPALTHVRGCWAVDLILGKS
jgi:hypothetical protein